MKPGPLGLMVCACALPAALIACAAFCQQSSPHPSAVVPRARVAAATGVFYYPDIAPIVDRLGCATSSCHGASTGKGGLKLSLFCGDPGADCEALARGSDGRRVNIGKPAGSLLLQKITGAVPHGGKQLVKAGSPECKRLIAWIAQGARLIAPGEPRVTSVVIAPSVWSAPISPVTMGPGASSFNRQSTSDNRQSLRLRVTAQFSDGTRRDVTRDATYRVTEPAVASVAADGKVATRGAGQCWVVATYLHSPCVARILVPRKLPFKFPAVRGNNRIDELCLVQQRVLGIPPSPLCSDAVFIRRVYLDAIGRLPTQDEVSAFMKDKRPSKRSALIDGLLERDEFADFWALKWSDLLRIKSEYPVRLWPKATETYYRWVHDSVAANKPFDHFATELLTSTGSNFRSGPANYYRAVTNRDARTFGETSALLFMGVRIGCARCHDHPTEHWTRRDDLCMGAFFTGMRFKATQEWKEEVVYLDPDAVMRNPDKTSEIVAPAFPGEATPAPIAAPAAPAPVAKPAAAPPAPAAKPTTANTPSTKSVAPAVHGAPRPPITRVPGAPNVVGLKSAARPAVSAPPKPGSTATPAAQPSPAGNPSRTVAAQPPSRKPTAGSSPSLLGEGVGGRGDVFAGYVPPVDPRERFAQWLTSPKNPWFAPAISNRVWYWLMGRGIVQEPDDMRVSNPPSNPRLLAYLARELVSHHYDTKHLFRLILNSRTYQLSSAPNRWNQADTTQFSHHLLRRLGAEQLLDAVCQITESSESFSSNIPEPYTHLEKGMRAVQVADGSITTPFLALYGRPARNSPYETERCARTAVRQAMVLVNSDQIESKIVSGLRAKHLAESGKSDAAIVDDIYLSALSRPPSKSEGQAAVAYLAKSPKAKLEAIQDLLWVVVNTREFMFDR